MISRLHITVYNYISRPQCTKDGEWELKWMRAINQDRRGRIGERLESFSVHWEMISLVFLCDNITRQRYGGLKYLGFSGQTQWWEHFNLAFDYMWKGDLPSRMFCPIRTILTVWQEKVWVQSAVVEDEFQSGQLETGKYQTVYKDGCLLALYKKWKYCTCDVIWSQTAQ